MKPRWITFSTDSPDEAEEFLRLVQANDDPAADVSPLGNPGQYLLTTSLRLDTLQAIAAQASLFTLKQSLELM
jgi:hypothetical protein